MYLLTLLTGFILYASISARPRDLNRQMQHIAQFGHQSQYSSLQQYEAQNRHFDEELEQIQRTDNQLQGNILKTTKHYIESVENQKNSEPLKQEQRNIEQIKNNGINQESVEQLQTHTRNDDVKTGTEKEESILQNPQPIPNAPVKDIKTNDNHGTTPQEQENSGTERDSETNNQQNIFLNKDQINIINAKDEHENQKIDGFNDGTNVPTKMALAELEEQWQRLHISSVSTIKMENNVNQQHVTSPVQTNSMSSSTSDTHAEISNINTNTNDKGILVDVHGNEQGLKTNHEKGINTYTEAEKINDKDNEDGILLSTVLPESFATSTIKHPGGVDRGTENKDKNKKKTEEDKITSEPMLKEDIENKNKNVDNAEEEEILAKATLKDGTENKDKAYKKSTEDKITSEDILKDDIENKNNEKADKEDILGKDILKDDTGNKEKNEEKEEDIPHKNTFKDDTEDKNNIGMADEAEIQHEDSLKDDTENEDKNKIEKEEIPSENIVKDDKEIKNKYIDSREEDTLNDDTEHKGNIIENAGEDTLKIISQKHSSNDVDKVSHPSSIVPGAASLSSDVTPTFSTVNVEQSENDVHEPENEEVILSTRTEKRSQTMTVNVLKSTVTEPKSTITTHVKDVESVRTSRSPQKFGESPENANKKNNEDNEQNTDNTYDGRGCSDRLYTGSAVIASCVGGIFIGVFLVLFLINARHKCKKYMNGDYRPVPMEYDFELNPRLKNH